ncbi:MAG: hypothetical protein ABEJ99_05855 [Candidatus Nanohaloarchaea archaeon]
MTDSAGISISEFLAGAIAVGIALVIVPQIIMGQTTGGSQGLGMSSTSSLAVKIERICSDKSDSETGNLNLKTGQSIVLEGKNVYLRGSSKRIDSHKVSCRLQGSKKVITTSGPYYIRSAGGGYEYK